MFAQRMRLERKQFIMGSSEKKLTTNGCTEPFDIEATPDNQIVKEQKYEGDKKLSSTETDKSLKINKCFNTFR